MIKFAIIGCGRIAERHAQHIKNFGELKAVCDIKKERAKQLGKKYNVPAYYSIDDLLENESDADVISVCTPNGLHAQHTIKSLKKGFHVLCEKPMALSVNDCEDMIKESEKANKKLFVVKQNRYNPPVAALKKAIEEGRLGKILSVQLNCFWNRNENYYKNHDWKGTKNLDGGILYTQFSHFIDLLYWLIGDIENAYSINKNFLRKNIIEFEDSGVAMLKFNNGAIGSIHYTINSYGKNMEGSITIFGEKGTVKIGGQYLNELEYQNIENYKIANLPQGNPANNYGEYKGSMSNHDKVYQNVIDVLKNNGTIATSGCEGLKTIKIINKIYDADNQ